MSISRVTPEKQKNSYIGYTTTTLSRVTLHLCENSAIKQYLIIKRNNNTNQLTSTDVRKSPSDDLITMYKKDNKKAITNPISNMHERF